jgi:phosphoketolase
VIITNDPYAPGAAIAESTREMGRFLRDVMKLNMEARNFGRFSHDDVHPHHRRDVQSARQVAEGVQPDRMAAADRLAQLSAVEPCPAAGRSLASGIVGIRS